MVLIYIKDKELLGKIMTYLELEKIDYTTNINDNYDCAIIANIGEKELEIIYKTRTIFITYLIENKLNNENLEKIKPFINKCDHIITSMPYYKKLIEKYTYKQISVLEKQILSINVDKRSLKNKYLVILDFNYENLSIVQELSLNTNYDIYYLGCSKLNKKEKIIYDNLSKKVKKIHLIDYINYIDIIKKAYIVIDMNNKIEVTYQNIAILLNKILIIQDKEYYENYLIPSKEVYYYSDLKDLITKINKIDSKRFSDLRENALEKISKNNCKTIAVKLKEILK